MSAPTATKWVYDFRGGSRDMRNLARRQGGANIVVAARVLGPDCPLPVFTITTEACVAYMHGADGGPEGLDDAIDEALDRLEEQAGKRLDDPENPLLVSVRSGARDSMPGMMDTVLNLGLNDETVAASRRAPATTGSRGLLSPPGADVRRRGLRRAPANASRMRSPPSSASTT